MRSSRTFPGQAYFFMQSIASGETFSAGSLEAAHEYGLANDLALAEKLGPLLPALEAFARGKHVLSEKPLASTVEAGQRIIDRQALAQAAQADREIKLQDTRVKSAREQATRFQQLAGEKFVSDLVAKQKQDEVTEQEIMDAMLTANRHGHVRLWFGAQVASSPAPSILADSRISPGSWLK